MNLRHGLFLLIVFISGLSVAAHARNSSSITRFGNNISIGPTDEVSDLTCFGCNIRIRGLVAGDVTTFGGSITVEDQAQIAGDVTSLGGNLRLDKAVKVSGDVTIIGGTLDRAPEAGIGGDVTTFSGRGWLLLVVASPFLVLGLLLALVIWLIQRIRRPAVPATAA
jgi:cytoskeletal protein CcmA (bactofilin family)